MKRKRNKIYTLYEKYPPSEACSCAICLAYCRRPGWWTVAEAARAIDAGYALRMMLEIAPEFTFGVLSPAFKECEGGLALNLHASKGCNFLKNNLCELYDTGLMPLECRFCHHDRAGRGQQCHLDIEADWNTATGKGLVIKWAKQVQFWDRYNSFYR